MKPLFLVLSTFLSLAAAPAMAQITITPPPEVSALMAACTPTDAQPEAILAGLRERGWVAPETDRHRAALGDHRRALLVCRNSG